MSAALESMPTGQAYGFWSYAHEDNDLDDGAVLALATSLRKEYNLLSGHPLDLFVDRDGITWGDEWRQRINSSLNQTTFFIPIITPRYFKRPECRRELLEFAAKAKSLGDDELLLPILYVETPGLSEQSPDQAMALVAKMQYIDWRRLRLSGVGSQEHKSAINVLAQRLIEIAGRVEQNQLSSEMAVGQQGDETAGIADLMADINRLLPDWLDAVMGDKFNTRQFHANGTEFNQQLQRLAKSHAPASVILAAKLRFGQEMHPLVERFNREAQIYAARSTELDPLISALARLISADPDSWPLVLPLRESIDEAMISIRRGEGNKDQPGWEDFFGSMRNLGRIFQQNNAIYRHAQDLVSEGNDIVTRWDTELKP